MSKEMSGIEQAVEWAGSQSALARQIGVSPQAVQQWVGRGCVPPRRVPLVAEVTGIPAHLLNPESHLGLYRPQPVGAPALVPMVCEAAAGYCPNNPARNTKPRPEQEEADAEDSQYPSRTVDR